MERKFSKTRVIRKISVLFLLMFSFVMSSVSASAATNKAARIYVTFDGKKEVKDGDWDKHVYSINTLLPKKMKVKAGMTVSYKLYIPASLLKKNEHSLDICVDLGLLKENKKGLYGVGSINKCRWLTLNKEGKKVTAHIYNEPLDKVEKFSKYASLKKSGKYYVVTMKDVLPKYYYDYEAGKTKKINTKTSYTIVPSLVIHGNGKFSGYIYLDELSVKGSKTQKVTYNSASGYEDVWARYWGGKDWSKKMKIVKF